jgi:hypothetical protein
MCVTRQVVEVHAFGPISYFKFKDNGFKNNNNNKRMFMNKKEKESEIFEAKHNPN